MDTVLKTNKAQPYSVGRYFVAAGLGLAVASAIIASGPVVALETIARQAILVEVATGTTLFEKNADQLMAPASMSKMMTAYMAFERLRDSSISLEDTFVVSENAWRKGGAKSGGSTMFLEPGSRVRIESLLRGIIIQSGNDASIVMAEGLAGSEQGLADEMTARGKELGMLNSTFKNATGWPNEEHRTTARDLSVLARRTITDFPQFYHYYSERQFSYNGIRQGNRNPLLGKEMGADGLKTGHTQESGYGLTGSAIRNGRRLILVINGLPSSNARARESERLIEWGFREFNNYALFNAGDVVTDAAVWLGKAQSVPLIIKENLLITLPRKARRSMKVSVSYEGPVPAPVTEGATLATLRITVPNKPPVEVPLVAGAAVERLGVVGRLGKALEYILWGGAG